jgi:hypothetical protein
LAVRFIVGGFSVISWQSVLLVEEFQLYLGSQFYWWRNFSYILAVSFIGGGISVISWQSVLLVEETGEHRENHRFAAKY